MNLLLPVFKSPQGIFASLILGMVAWWLGPVIPGFNSVLLALLLGMIVRNTIQIPETYQSGIAFTSSKLLELSILFLAFGIHYTHLLELGWQRFATVALTIVLVLMSTIYFAKRFNCPGSTGWLVGFGTAICGSSAIAALAPSVSKNRYDPGIAMAVVNLYGTVGMISLPLLLQALHLPASQMGLLIGGSLHSIGNVAGAGYSINPETGDAAMLIKLARVALLSPAIVFFNFLINRHTSLNWKKYFNLPWYLWSFMLITLVVSFIPLSTQLLTAFEETGKVILTIAMAAIGLNISIKTLWISGRKGLLFGFLIFVLMLISLIGFSYTWQLVRV